MNLRRVVFVLVILNEIRGLVVVGTILWAAKGLPMIHW